MLVLQRDHICLPSYHMIITIRYAALYRHCALPHQIL